MSNPSALRNDRSKRCTFFTTFSLGVVTSLRFVVYLSDAKKFEEVVPLGGSWFLDFDPLVMIIAGISTATTIRHAHSVITMSLLEVSIVVVDVLRIVGNISRNRIKKCTFNLQSNECTLALLNHKIIQQQESITSRHDSIYKMTYNH